ncbi:UDP-N-acetylmuramoyl-L-alanine--D-glutamate ligase [Soehngenia longivitae]|uniref:UDP-N-acetylmuramoylalanine--D-glutamate ligase n=1 Tax=Soehngenia longivitae TaxID=2562294 RepID=A0A4Z0D5R7_9FIRM|nr:UDP-N-acetylmuramoyl-L-alanine--D-glutamate ligase [Soehngenia longivitae]TFZ40093.1 UDP-N-acetylmuramoyl-L-alanine--D-glutamate ligase [Soehngenia longivitae]
MIVDNKNVLVLGVGMTGISVLNFLKSKTNNIYVYDDLPYPDIVRKLNNAGIYDVVIVDSKSKLISNMDIIITSPGFPPYHEVIVKAKSSLIPIISDIELAYHYRKSSNIYGITGTNGKTTSTVLLTEILKKDGFKVEALGNIGMPTIERLTNCSFDDNFVIELSSFQLEYTNDFRPKAALILNITEDHLNWHGSMDSYIAAKLKIFANQKEDDLLVLNYDDEILRKINVNNKPKLMYFSVKNPLNEGIFIKDGKIVFKTENLQEEIINIEKIKLPGKHNLENICGVLAICKHLGVSKDSIESVLSSFRGVAHRIEFVATKNDVEYYNDSKGTNVDSSIKAIEALKGPIILIAGGYDKNADYTRLIEALKDKCKALIVLGQTKEKIKDTAYSNNFLNVYIANDMREAVDIATNLSSPNDQVLLSPACASWDMYNNYEERGDHFKKIVNDIME